MNIEPEHRRGILIGALIGAIVGASAAYLLMTAPATDDLEIKPLKTRDLLDLTNTATKLFRQLDGVRNRT